MGDDDARQRLVLAPAFLRELAEGNPWGLRLSVEEVDAWWESVWPTFKTYDYKNERRAIRKWWARARGWELARARAVVREREKVALQEQEQRSQEDQDLRAVGPEALRALFGRGR